VQEDNHKIAEALCVGRRILVVVNLVVYTVTILFNGVTFLRFLNGLENWREYACRSGLAVVRC
jgi:hypothetical protein